MDAFVFLLYILIVADQELFGTPATTDLIGRDSYQHLFGKSSVWDMNGYFSLHYFQCPIGAFYEEVLMSTLYLMPFQNEEC